MLEEDSEVRRQESEGRKIDARSGCEGNCGNDSGFLPPAPDCSKKRMLNERTKPLSPLDSTKAQKNEAKRTPIRPYSSSPGTEHKGTRRRLIFCDIPVLVTCSRPLGRPPPRSGVASSHQLTKTLHIRPERQHKVGMSVLYKVEISTLIMARRGRKKGGKTATDFETKACLTP